MKYSYKLYCAIRSQVNTILGVELRKEAPSQLSWLSMFNYSLLLHPKGIANTFVYRIPLISY